VKLIVDTNVFVPGVFFSGPPFMILDAWRHGITIMKPGAVVDKDLKRR